MIRTFSFFVAGLPVAKQYQSKFGQEYRKASVVQWEKTVGQYAMVSAGAGYKKMFGAISMRLDFLLPIPKSRKEVKNFTPHLQDPDLTNLLKATEDGIKKVLFHDDCMVWKTQVEKRWVTAGGEGVRVHVEVEVE